MRNSKNSFDRTGEISREPNQRVGWLEAFAEKMASQEQARVKTASRVSTAVEVARDRYNAPQPSVYDLMSSIISAKKPKFSSVDEAVKHYQESTGLSQYLRAQKEDGMSALAAVIAQVSEDEDELNDCDNAADDCDNAADDCDNAADDCDKLASLDDVIRAFHSRGSSKKKV